MHRNGPAALAALILALGSLSCTGSEQQLVQTFFTAIQGGDEVMASGVSVAQFPGSVTAWEILEIGPESKEPFGLSALREEFQELDAALEKEKRDGEAFLEKNARQAAEFQRRLQRDPKYKFQGELAEFQAEWDRRIAAQEDLMAQIEDAKQRISDLRSAAGLSLNTNVSDSFDGEVKGKLVRLKVSDGSEEKTYTFKLQRFELADTERNLTPMARWIITEIDQEV
jgi:hypothetical protein